MHRKGFTLIELLVAISIIALLSSIVLASLNGAREKSRVAAAMRFDASAYHALASDAVAILSFEEGPGATTANDLSGNSNNGSISGAAWSSTTYGAKSSYSLNFDGTDDFVSVSHAQSQLITGSGAISAWIYPRGLGETAGRIADKSTDTGGNNGFLLALEGSNRVQFKINNQTTVYSGSESVSYNRWMHVLVSWDETGLATFYINGLQSGSPANAGSPTGMTTTAPLTIGNRSNNTDRTFNGYIDDVRVYAQSLSLAEVQGIYRASLEARVADSR